MPVNGIFSTTEYQQKLMHGIQDKLFRVMKKANGYLVPLLDKDYGVVAHFMAALGFAWALKDLAIVVYRLWRLGKPTHENTQRHNSHKLIDLRDYFLAHDRCFKQIVYEMFFNLAIIKYEFDGHFGRRFDKCIEWICKAEWVFTGKHPETEWVLTEEEENEPTHKRYKALQKALANEEYDKVLNLID